MAKAQSRKSTGVVKPAAVISFWFDELNKEDWFIKTDKTDAACRDRFAATHLALAKSVPEEWRADAEAHLALIILFDQFPRNIYRDTPLAFATDGLALKEARAAVERGHDQALGADRRVFFYMPYEHSENLADQHRAVELIGRLGDETYTKYAEAHRDVIEKFGRFPHRNAILGRISTPAEERYLAEPGAGF
jgi:uncharacterized protein (DUF924 family)